jgi:hypothetical protein
VSGRFSAHAAPKGRLIEPALFLLRIRGLLLLIGQAVPFLCHSYHCGAALAGREAPSQEMAIARKLPVLIRSGGHCHRPPT